MPRLWRYNLHYFDYLRDPERSDAEKRHLLHSWVTGNPQGSQPGWEPFTASLRIVNWIFYFHRHPEAISSELLVSLYTQVLWLERNDERHILANHYFENLKALAFAGAFFEGADAARWRSRAVRELREQLLEQTLTDGGHYERTPQYHGLMLENYLDLLNLFSRNTSLFSRDIAQLYDRHCRQGLQFYQAILFPDQQLPLFNDSAFGISPSLADLDAYYCRLTGGSALPEPASALIKLKDSGLFGYRHHQSMLIIDAGDIGPSYQPGHTHCDMLSYELMWDGERIIVDSGVCEYEPGEMRRYVRSTRAHNTVSIDGAEQSEVWGEFRVARRAKINHAHVNLQPDRFEFDGAYTGFPALRGQFAHQRRVSLTLAAGGQFGSLYVEDSVTGAGCHNVESCIHFHPDITIQEQNAVSMTFVSPLGRRYRLDWSPDINFYREQGFYCPEFGVKIPNTRIVLVKQQRLPAVIGYSITTIN